MGVAAAVDGGDVKMDIKEIMNSVRGFDAESLYNSFLGLPPQQQTMAIGGSALALLLMLVLPISIAAGKLGSLESRIAEARTGVDAMVTEVQRYQTLQQEKEAIEGVFKRQSGDFLMTVIEKIAADTEVKAEQLQKKPPVSEDIYEEERASFVVQSVPLEQLVKVLHALESSPQKIIQIKELIVKPVYGNRAVLNAEFREVSTYKLVTEEK